MCAVIAKKLDFFLKVEKSFFIKYFKFLFIMGVNLWLSTLAKPWPGICLITVPILFEWKLFMQISPIFETILGSFENDLSPITELEPFNLKSRTGRVLIFAPIDFYNKDVCFIKIL